LPHTGVREWETSLYASEVVGGSGMSLVEYGSCC